MKNISILLVLITSLVSCKSLNNGTTTNNTDEVSFYDYNDKPITDTDISNDWTERIQLITESYSNHITNLEITSIKDNATQKDQLILLGNTNNDAIKTATKLTKTKKGLKLSDITVSCINCNTEELNLGLKEGHWYCINKKELTENQCTKTETMRTTSDDF